MFCHDHLDQKAVQYCACCSQGLCPECLEAAPEYYDKIACSKECLAKIVEETEKEPLLNKTYNMTMQNQASGGVVNPFITAGHAGLILVVMGLYSWYTTGMADGYTLFPLSIGSLLLAGAYFQAHRKK